MCSSLLCLQGSSTAMDGKKVAVFTKPELRKLDGPIGDAVEEEHDNDMRQTEQRQSGGSSSSGSGSGSESGPEHEEGYEAMGVTSSSREGRRVPAASAGTAGRQQPAAAAVSPATTKAKAKLGGGTATKKGAAGSGKGGRKTFRDLQKQTQEELATKRYTD